MLRFNDIADRMMEYNPGVDLELLQRAYVYSAKVHDGQERLSGEPYLVHPLEVAGILTEMRVDVVTVAAGLLHDTLEDTLSTREEIERLFGARVAFLVEGLTKIAKIEFTSARERQAENFRKMLVAMSRDIRILLIKLADRLHNMRTLGYMKDDSRRRIAQETLEIYVPLAHRLGIHWMKQELEDLAFRELNADVIEELEGRLVGSREEREKYMAEVLGILATKLGAAGLDVDVTGRVKDLASIYAKMESQNIDFDQIYDMIAFRIVIEGPAESCYAALGLVHQTWHPVPARFKDYIAVPKRNGYQSLHTTVIGQYGERMEVQIRSAEMHRDAEQGVAAHWGYKEGTLDTDGEELRQFAWLRQLLELQKDVSDPHEFLEAVKVDLFPDEVFVFTPRGEVVTLPRRATPVDFAYAIHSEVGDRCAGAKVNGIMVPLRRPLVDGDTVEIVTSRSQFPRKDWLEFVVSGKARTRIRQAIRRVGRDGSRQLGRDLLERELRKAGLTPRALIASGELAEVAQRHFKSRDVEDLFLAISYGKVAVRTVVAKLKGEEAAAPAPPATAARSASRRLRSLFRREKSGADDSGIRVSGLPHVMVRFGGCCNPLPGDEVVGFVTRGRGVTVHAKDCRRVFELDPDRRIEVDWDNQSSAPRKIKLRVRSKDQPGILAKITQSISVAGINIASADITTHRGQPAVQRFELWVTNVEMLNGIMREIRRVKGVQSVERIRG